MANKRDQIINFLNKNGFKDAFNTDFLFQQAVNAIELYTSKKENRKTVKISEEELLAYETLAVNINAFFPAKTKIPTSGLLACSPIKEVKDGLIWFSKEYPEYSVETILRATSSYIEEYRNKNWEYMRTSKYFIRKQNTDKSWTSTLANYCNQIVQEVDNNIDNNFQNMGPRVV